MSIEKIRDLTLVSLDSEKSLVISCDSSGSIGMKEKDVLKIPPFYVGKFTARVAIMEVMCAGGNIVTLTNALSCEMKPTGVEIIKGIKEELKSAKIDDISLTGSTEENFKTYSTGVGVTVIGVGKRNELKINNIKDKEGCIIISIGIPKVGDEIDIKNDREIVSYDSIKWILENDLSYEMVPVGSKGILYEAKLLCKNNNSRLKTNKDVRVDIYKSSGPSTCIIAAVKKKDLKSITSHIDYINIIGELENLRK